MLTTFWRALRILWLGSGYALARLRDRLWPARKVAGPVRLRILFERLGGTYIKLGQLLALQPDIMPLAYCDELMKLLDRVPPFPYAGVEKVFVEELGKTPPELFESFERRPLASASVAQVHVAFLNGRKVAVKVQRPTVSQDFAPDIRLMWTVVRVIEGLRWDRIAWLARPLREFVTWTREELDFRREARYMKALAYQTRDLKTAVIPRVYERFTRRRIMVAEFLEGPTLLDYIRSLETPDPELERRLGELRFDAPQLARNVIDNFVGTAFRDGIFHADLHPANLLILPDSVVGYVDFGITGALSPYTRRSLAFMTLELTRAKPEALLEGFLKIATTEADSDVEGMLEGMRDHMKKWFGGLGPGHRMRTNFTIFMLDMLNLSRRYRIWPNPDVVRYIRSVVATDGLITRFAPAVEVDRYLGRSCERHFTAEERRRLEVSEQLADWTATGARLLATGSGRTANWIDQLSASGSGRRVGSEASNNGRRCDDRTRRRLRAMRLTLVLLTLVGLLFVSDPEPGWGMNLFTVATLATPIAAIALLLTLRRLA